MKTIRLLGLVLLGALALNARAQTNVKKQPFFKGTVVDGAGRPIERVTIESCRFNWTTESGSEKREIKDRAVSDTNGAFGVTLPYRFAVVLARKPGFAPAWWQSWSARGEIKQQLVLTPPTVLAGTVVDEADKPVTNADVFVTAAAVETTSDGGGDLLNNLNDKTARELFNTRSGAEGRFRIENFPTNASAMLGVRAPGKTLPVSARQSSSPDLMPYPAGQEDIRLVLEPVGSIEGKIVAEGANQPLPTARLVLQSDTPGINEFPAVESGADGTFRIPEVAAGNYRIRAEFGPKAAPDWVAESVSVSVETGQVTRNVEIPATRGGLLKVTVLGKKDRKPLTKVGVYAYQQSYQGDARSDTNGVALLRVPPGEYQVGAWREGMQSEQSAVTVEAGKTNLLEIELAAPAKIMGVVRDPDRQPAAGVDVRIVSAYSPGGNSVKTDAKGKFEIEWNPRPFGRSDMTYCVLARDPERNLALAQDIDEDTGPLDLQLAPALTIAGRAECDGKPITNATAILAFLTDRGRVSLPSVGVRTNKPGNFEIPALPPGRQYWLYVSAPGYGPKSFDVAESDEAKRVELEPVELKPANLRLAGKVVDADDKPLADASVHFYGEDQPNGSTRTDPEGWFHFDTVCEGVVWLSASARNSRGSISAEGGDTNVVLRLSQDAGDARRVPIAAPKRASLKGSPLPDLASVGLAADAAPADKPLLLCLLDAEQRPSRHVARRLAEQHDALKQKGVNVAVVQVRTSTSTETFQEWTNSSPMPFPVGCVAEKSAANKWATSVTSLPWLILRDASGTVAAEGFALEELHAKLEALNQ